MKADDDELDLNYLLNILKRRKWIVVGIFCLVFIPTAVYHALTPAIFKGEVILKVTAPEETLTPQELEILIGVFTPEKIQAIFPENHALKEIKLRTKDSKKIALIIESSDPDILPRAFECVLKFIMESYEMKVLNEKMISGIRDQIEIIAAGKREIDLVLKSVNNLVMKGELYKLGFDPSEIYMRSHELSLQKYRLEKAEKNSITLKALNKPDIVHVRPRTLRNMGLAGLSGILLGLFVIFFLEYIVKIRKHMKDTQNGFKNFQ